MAIFKDILGADESLFVNPMALDFDYLPKELPHRENQQHYLATCIKPLFHGINGKNILITGVPGIGKTAAVRWVLRDLEQEGLDSQVQPIFINCWKKDTAHKILLEVCNQVGYKFVINKTTDDLMRAVAEILNKKAAVIVLDEVDKIDSQQIIYQFLEDIYRKCIFLITNDKGWLSELDNRVRSRLLPEDVRFEQYNYNETLDILKQRVRYAFVTDVWIEDALERVAEKTVEVGDIRVGIFLLKEAGNIAEMRSSRKVTFEHVESAIEKLADFKPVSSKDLGEEEKEILEIIKTNSGKSVKELYEVYKNKYNKSYRTFHRKIKILEESGLIDVKEQAMEKGGKELILLFKTI